ncbi:TetR/AcrR family transcriptional regulator C-terminal domain-containing protein [Actinocrispum sp. NPDC049592]|uniref:TetR/AcrR family transcriptional regulator C-terminal domain-containing protein n=1 Tax=Actinocrispum sp. NPDC049592 TaxID=3154835 RepID=UPI0034411240
MDPALVWQKDRRTPRRQAPSVEQIVATAIAIADTEGLEALSMRRVAGDLGSGTASLYRYVASRDELLDLMIDEVRSAPVELTGDWRADLSAIARDIRATLLRHPWLVAELAGRPALGANSLRHYDTTLAAVASLTPDVDLAAGIAATVTAYVRGAVSGELAELQAQRRSGMTKTQWRHSVGAYVRDVIESGEYPHFARQVVEGSDRSADERFEFGLACVLDGIAARS